MKSKWKIEHNISYGETYHLRELEGPMYYPFRNITESSYYITFSEEKGELSFKKNDIRIVNLEEFDHLIDSVIKRDGNNGNEEETETII